MPAYKVIKRKPGVPVMAIQLSEDLLRLERIHADLKLIEPWNIGEIQTQSQRDFCDDMLRSTIALVLSWQRYAKRKLQTEYLAP